MTKVLLDLALILLVAQVIGAVFARIGQPRVIGQIVGGILLGASLLGLLPGNPSHWLFPASAIAQLKTIGQLGLSVFMFTIGWDLDLAAVRRAMPAASAISTASTLLPFALGLALADAFYPAHLGSRSDLGYWPFALFIGASLSITAFPVLARILAETRMTGSRIGVTVLAAAALDDVFGWSILAVVFAFAAGGGAWDYARVILETIAFGIGVVSIAKPLMGRATQAAVRGGVSRTAAVGLILAAVLGASSATNAIGVHAVFGAFLLGAVMPRWRGVEALSEWRRALDPIVIFLLPVYFVVSGLAVDLTKLSAADAGYFVLILLTATLGKFAGAFLTARTSVSARDAATIGVLMNTRGLIEIVALTIGLEKGIIDVRLFSLLVLMALLTTVVAVPALHALRPTVPSQSEPQPVPQRDRHGARL